ncbi:hypothetical protein ACFS7Z_15725 [Pontibacter toksunensis]|uniref:Cytochrome c domain-containing protein n=2 Tax=Pontibacter toksunensis TaxID=1332631 RepID=A0ABW6BVK3_9BACT
MKRITFALLPLLIFMLSLVSACKEDNEEDLNPQPTPQQNCDTNAITYSEHVQAILKTNCYSCHSTGIASGGVVLDTHAGVKAQADNGKLVGVVSHTAGFKPMPQGGAKLSDCNIAKIKKWVDDGAVNN